MGGNISVKEILFATKGRLIKGTESSLFNSLSIDSRSISQNDIFLCLKGKNFDAHGFISEAVQRGATGIIIEDTYSLNSKFIKTHNLTIIAVKNTLRALGDIGFYWRKMNPVPIAAITGSNGKTTTKEIAASILKKRFNILISEGNRNNLIGLPLTLLELNSLHEMAVVELGTNVKGEMKRLTEICKPDIGLITNIGYTHIESFKTIEGVAEEKGDLFRGIGENGTIIFNYDDPYSVSLVRESKSKKISFGLNREADICGEILKSGDSFKIKFLLIINKSDEAEIHLSLFGSYNVYNALAASAIAHTLGSDLSCIRKGIEEFRPVPLRSEVLYLKNGVTLINDSYNSNPVSMELTLKDFYKEAKDSRKIVILGDMLELGEISSNAHRELGKRVKEIGIEFLFYVGEYGNDVVEVAINSGMREENISIEKGHEGVKHLILKILKPGDWILVKGSRGLKMENVVNDLIKEIGLK